MGGVTWAVLLSHWNKIEMDLQERGIDLGDKALLRARSWRWLQVRIVGLISAPGSRLQRELYPKQTPRHLYPYPPDQIKNTQ